MHLDSGGLVVHLRCSVHLGGAGRLQVHGCIVHGCIAHLANVVHLHGGKHHGGGDRCYGRRRIMRLGSGVLVVHLHGGGCVQGFGVVGVGVGIGRVGCMDSVTSMHFATRSARGRLRRKL